MPIYLGSSERKDIYLGGSEIQKVYLGQALVYSKFEIVFPIGSTSETTSKSDTTDKIVTFNSDGSLSYSTGGNGLSATLSPNEWATSPPADQGLLGSYYIRLNTLVLSGTTASRAIVTNATFPDGFGFNWDSLSTPKYFGLRATTVGQAGVTIATVNYSIAYYTGFLFEVVGGGEFEIEVSYF
jgi:hypothetical protein